MTGIYRDEHDYFGALENAAFRSCLTNKMTAADIGLDAVWKPLYPYCREFHIFGHMNGAPILVENTLWR